MSGFTVRSRSTASLLSAILLASVVLTQGAAAAPFSAGNSFEIPLVPHDRMDRAYAIAPQNLMGGNAAEIPLVGTGGMYVPPATVQAHTARTHQAPGVVARSSGNATSACVNGYRWSPTAASGWTLPMPCSG